MEAFGVVLVSVDTYPEPPGSLPSSTSAGRLAELLGNGRGGLVVESVVAGSEAEVKKTLRRWAQNRERPPCSVVYLAGHGRGDGLDHWFQVPNDDEDDEVIDVPTGQLAEFLQTDWVRRQGDTTAWTLVILDCCASQTGVFNIEQALARTAIKRPRRLGLWPVAPEGAARSGQFVAALGRAIDGLDDLDAHVPLDSLFRRIRGEIGNPEPVGFLPDEAAITLPTPEPTPVTLDVLAELRRAIESRPPEIQGHFLAKARGGDAGEVAWRFSGRERETAALMDWLDHGPHLQVVTGEAGSGKSALLGHLVTLADHQLVRLYDESGLAPELAQMPRPADGVFDAVVHLTGKTAFESIDEVSTQLGLVEGDDTVEAAGDLPARTGQFVHGVRVGERQGAVVLVDALDEAQDPEHIAEFIREVTDLGAVRVLVGTRRSTAEGPDQPADLERRDLLDALDAHGPEVLEVSRDPDAVRSYVVQRLDAEDSPYAGDESVGVIADRIAGFDHPFLFARLATAELVARPRLDLDGRELAELLDHGHRGVFAAAMARLGAADPAVAAMVRALAYARGLGLPRTDGTWLAAARAIEPDAVVDDAAGDRTLELAGPYVVLDAEARQSTYRLAHRTFAEHFETDPAHAAGHRRIGAALVEQFDRDDDDEAWLAAGHYPVRYLPEHLVADADSAPADLDRLVQLATGAGWLTRAVTTLGVDKVVEVLDAAITTVVDHGMRLLPDEHEQLLARDPEVMLASFPRLTLVQTVTRALRRSRRPLARSVEQLPAQLCARLHDEDDPRLATLGERCGSILGHRWLRMTTGSLDWRADLETTWDGVGKVRGVALGQVDGRPTVAVAIDHRVVLWDPRTGTVGAEHVVDLVDHRATAVAFAAIDGSSVLITTSAYDGITEWWDPGTGERLGSASNSLGHHLAVGTVGGRTVVAGVSYSDPVSFDVATREPVAPAPGLAGLAVWGFATDADRLVALSERAGPEPDTKNVVVQDPVSGEELWRSQPLPAGYIDAMAGGDLGDGTFAVVVAAAETTFWLTEGTMHIEETAHGARTRTLALGSVDGRPVVVAVPDYDATALVAVQQVRHRDAAGAVTLFRPRVIDAGYGSSHFDDAPVRHEYFPDVWGRQHDRPFVDRRPSDWPIGALARGVVGGTPVVVSGSVEGTAWVWDVSGGEPTPVAGPFAALDDFTRESGWGAFGRKPAAEVASAVAIESHPTLGTVVAIACDGHVRLWTLDGERIPSVADDALVVDAVALGTVADVDALVTGSRGGVVGVWSLDPSERVATVTVDDPVTDLRIVNGAISVRTGGGRDRVLELRSG